MIKYQAKIYKDGKGYSVESLDLPGCFFMEDTLEEAKTMGSDTTVFFPSAMKVLTDLKSGSGRIYNELGDSSDTSFKVSMKAGSGDLKIKKLQ